MDACGAASRFMSAVVAVLGRIKTFVYSLSKVCVIRRKLVKILEPTQLKKRVENSEKCWNADPKASVSSRQSTASTLLVDAVTCLNNKKLNLRFLLFLLILVFSSLYYRAPVNAHLVTIANIAILHILAMFYATMTARMLIFLLMLIMPTLLLY